MEQGILLSPVEIPNPIVDGDVEPPAGAFKTNDHELHVQTQFRDGLSFKSIYATSEIYTVTNIHHISFFALKKKDTFLS